MSSPLQNLSIPSPSSSSTTSKALIYFIPGNPGLISYYTPFLTLLSSLISSSPSISWDIYGQDLLGFSDSSHHSFSQTNLPWDLEGQIRHGQRTVAEKGRGYDFVVLMGHSVGAYIAVEIFSRWQSLMAREGNTEKREKGLELRNGVLLFPTLTHIAKSPSGRMLVSLSNFPYFATHSHLLAKALLFPIPRGVLQWVLQRVMGFTPSAASITTDWLKSRDGIQQALYLGMNEMNTIKENIWEEDLWSLKAASEVGEVNDVKGNSRGDSRFYFFYAEEDHWVDKVERDELLGKLSGKVRVEMGEGVKHAFCTKEYDTWVVARGVAGWLGEMDG